MYPTANASAASPPSRDPRGRRGALERPSLPSALKGALSDEKYGEWRGFTQMGWLPLIAGCVVIAASVIVLWEWMMVRLHFAPADPRARLLFAGRALVTSTLLATWAGWYILRARGRIERLRQSIRDAHEAVERERLHMLQLEAAAAYARSLAHEFRTPLHSIRLHATVAARAARSASDGTRSELAQALGTIESETDRMASFVDEYVRFSELVLDPGTLVRVDLAEVFRTRMAAVRAGAGGVPVVDRLPATLPVRGDPRRLDRLCDVLLSQAVTAVHGDATIEVRGEVAGDRVVLIVTDTGPPLGDPAAAFRPFHPGRSGVGGAALAVARDIVRSHSGEILAENNVGGEGVNIHVRLPAWKADS